MNHSSTSTASLLFTFAMIEFGLKGFKDSVTPAMIDSLKTFVGYRKVHLEGKKVVKDDPRLLLNCSAIAKGYSCDVIARLLEKEGVENYMILIGGEVIVKGVNQNGVCWRTGINLPEDDPDGIKNNYDEIVQLCKKGAIATSGNYRNFYIKDGKKYAHTIDPRTGYHFGKRTGMHEYESCRCDGYRNK